MNIIYSCDDNYIEQTFISMVSVMENNKSVEDLLFYIVSKDIASENLKKLKKITHDYGRQLIIINFDDICYDLNISKIGRHIATIYSKVFFSRINALDKVIYFDSDTIITGNLSELWDTDLTGCYLGAVETFSKPIIRNKLGLTRDCPFFNDGVAIVNVDYCRKNDLIGKTLKVIDEYNGAPPTLSEGALNKICQGHVKFISLRYNLMAGILFDGLNDIKELSRMLHYPIEDLEYSCKHPIVIHYLTAFYNRPWFKGCTHPYRAEYHKYRALTEWKDTPLKTKKLPLKIKLLKYLIQLIGLRNFNKIRKLVTQE